MMAEPTGDLSLVQTIIGWAASLGGAAWGVIKHIDGKLDNKADEEDVKSCLHHIEKLFDNAEKDRQRVSDQAIILKDDIHEKFDALKTIIMDLKK